MKTTAVVQEAGNTALQALAGAGGLGAGLLIGSKIPAIGFGHMQKVTPGLAVMVLAYLAGTKLGKGENAEAAAIGAGIGGALLILKNYVPVDVFKKYFTPGLGNAPAPRTIEMVNTGNNTYKMLNGIGQAPENAYQLLN